MTKKNIVKTYVRDVRIKVILHKRFYLSQLNQTIILLLNNSGIIIFVSDEILDS